MSSSQKQFWYCELFQVIGGGGWMIVIRADGNAGIGAGHLMRCLTIADAIRQESGREIIFACADEESALLAERHGYETWILGTDYRDMESEIPRWEERFSSDNPSKNILLVDSYFVTIPYLAHLRRYGILVLLDDMAKQAYPVDAVVNYNVFAAQEKYDRLYRGTDTRCFVGGRFIPIRPVFWSAGYVVRDKAEDMLITTGGGDSQNIAAGILRAVYRTGMRYHIVTGRYNPHFAELKEMESTFPGVHVRHDVADMAGLMGQCDLAVTAGGTTVYELAALGVPFICFSYAENQEALTEYIDRQGIAGYGGAYHKEPGRTLENIAAQAALLAGDCELRRSYRIREKSMVDGLGARRLANILLEYSNFVDMENAGGKQ